MLFSLYHITLKNPNSHKQQSSLLSPQISLCFQKVMKIELSKQKTTECAMWRIKEITELSQSTVFQFSLCCLTRCPLWFLFAFALYCFM